MTSVDAERFAPDLDWFDATYGTGRHVPVAVFDFDGVLCAPDEDLVYKLEVERGEKAILHREAIRVGIDPDLFDIPYLRHLVMQEKLEDLERLPEPGPALELAKKLSETARPFFVLTARSGRAAVSRVLSFVRKHDLQPQELFFVGRVAKGRQLRMVREMVEDKRQVVYFEDSVRHTRNSRQQDFVGFETIHVLWGEPRWDIARKLYHDTLHYGEARGMVDAA